MKLIAPILLFIGYASLAPLQAQAPEKGPFYLTATVTDGHNSVSFLAPQPWPTKAACEEYMQSEKVQAANQSILDDLKSKGVTAAISNKCLTRGEIDELDTPDAK